MSTGMLMSGFIVHIIPVINCIIPFAVNLTSLHLMYFWEKQDIIFKKIERGTILYPSGTDWIVKSEHYNPEQRQVDWWEGLKSKSVLWSHFRGSTSLHSHFDKMHFSFFWNNVHHDVMLSLSVTGRNVRRVRRCSHPHEDQFSRFEEMWNIDLLWCLVTLMWRPSVWFY